MRVKDIMTSNSLKYCHPDTKIRDINGLMKSSNLSVLPVLDSSGRVIGLVTDHDIKTSLIKSKVGRLLNVDEIIIKEFYTVNSDDRINSALSYMMRNKIGRAFVVDNNKKLKGIVSIFKLISYNNNKRKPTHIIENSVPEKNVLQEME